MMKRAAGVFVILVVASGLWSYVSMSARSDSSAARLPGARPVIEAAEFPSLQAALDALPEEGGLVRLPPGHFVINQPLIIGKQDVSLVGSGTATHIENANEEGKPALWIAHPEAQQGSRKAEHRLWRVRVAHLRITGNEKSGPGIAAIGVNELFVDGVTVSENGGDGILLDQCYEDPRICNSLITYNGRVGVNLKGCHDIVVSANQFEENEDALHCTDGFNLCMTGNCVDDHLRHGVVIENTYGSVVSGNMIEECHDAAVLLDRDCYGIAISANVIAHNGRGVVLGDAHGCAVSANALTIMQNAAVEAHAQCDRIAITGNSFSDSYIGEGALRRKVDDRSAGGLVVSGAKDLGITGNVFSGLRPKAFELGESSGEDVLFVGNIVRDSAGDHGRLEPKNAGLNLTR